MYEYEAKVTWKRKANEVFIDQKYNREHKITFENGLAIDGSPSGRIVPVPYSNPNFLDPEQTFVASLSTCHMLFFLDLCSRDGIIVDSYTDDAIGVLKRTGRNKMAMTKVTLRPKGAYSGDNIPTMEQLEDIHHRAHELCYIANSVSSEIIAEIIS